MSSTSGTDQTSDAEDQDGANDKDDGGNTSDYDDYDKSNDSGFRRTEENDELNSDDKFCSSKGCNYEKLMTLPKPT